MSPVAVNVNEPVDGGGVFVTLTVTLPLVVPPLPVQERVYVPVVVRLVTVCEPLVVFVPLQLFTCADPAGRPLAVQDVALVELHVSVEELPLVTDVADAESETVGAGVEVPP